MTISGGKSAGSAAPWPFLKPGQAFLKEAFSPLGDDLPWQVEALSDLLVGEALCGKEDDLGAHDFAIRRRISSSGALQLFSLFLFKENDIWAFSWHNPPPFREVDSNKDADEWQLKYVIVFTFTCT